MMTKGLKISKDFFETENRCGYEVSSAMKQVWAVQLDLLYEFSQVCSKYNLNFFLCYGSLLGAVRHKGYIPWDDDIDIMMLRTDYDKLCEVAAIAFKDGYFFQTELTDPGYLLKHAKIRNTNTTCLFKSLDKYECKFNQGIFIDVFVLDNVPDNYDERIKWYQKLWRAWGNIWEISSYMHRNVRFSLIKNAWLKFLSLIGWHKVLYKYYDHLLKRYANTNTEYVADIVFTIKTNEISDKCTWKKTQFDKFIDADFEMIKVKIPYNYDSILAKTYGNWNILVPGGGSHSDLFFDTNKSYKEYIK